MQTTITRSAERLMTLFEGYSQAYGTYRAGGTSKPNVTRGKVEIKSSAKTVREAVTKKLWQEHIDGEEPIGIIPIRDNDTCLWGAIDVDTYGIVLEDVYDKLKRHSIPMVVCRSKSGGAHIFLFMAEPVPAGDIRDFLSKIAVLIGYGGSEIFPKQRAVHLTRGDLGSWLNMPYFGGDDSDRYAIGDNGNGLTMDQFLKLAESLRQPAVFLDQSPDKFDDPTNAKPHSDFGDGPPCMQRLSATGLPDGTRNNGVFAFASFAKKKFGVQWKTVIERWNRDLVSPPLDSSEMSEIIKQHDKKDYYYRCKDMPLAAHCNSALCRTRKYGVGGDDDFPVISGLSVLDTDPPLWFLDVEDARIELKTDELQNYKQFHKICMEQLFKCFRMMKQDAWLQVVGEAMKNAVKIEAPTEVGLTGQFYELLDTFLTDRYCGETREDLLTGRPFQEENKYYFRLKDLMQFLETNNFREYTRSQITTRIKRRGGAMHFFNVKGIGTNVWWVPVGTLNRMPELSIPNLEEDPL